MNEDLTIKSNAIDYLKTAYLEAIKQKNNYIYSLAFQEIVNAQGWRLSITNRRNNKILRNKFSVYLNILQPDPYSAIGKVLGYHDDIESAIFDLHPLIIEYLECKTTRAQLLNEIHEPQQD